MMDPEAPSELIRHAVNVLGRIDYVVLNHVIEYHFGDWLGAHENVTALERTFSVNFNAYVSIASHAMSHLELNKGSVIVMSSIAGRLTWPCMTPYESSSSRKWYFL